MNGFEKTPKKIFNIFNQSQKNIKNILNKKNDKELLKFQSDKYKNAKIFYDSGWIGVAPTVYETFRTTQKDALVPVTFTYNENTFSDLPIIQLPDELFAYLDPIIMVKGIPNTEFKGIANFEFSTWGENYYIVKGDNQLIYQGIQRAIGYTHNQESLNNGDFLEENTKKRFEMAFEYTKDGEYFKIVGDINRLQLFISYGEVESGKENYDRYNIAVDPNYSDNVDNEHRILNSIDKNTGLGLNVDIEFKGDLYETRWIDTNSIDSFTATTGQTVFALRYQPIGGSSGINSVKVNGGGVGWSFNTPNTIILNNPVNDGDNVTIDYQFYAQNITLTENITKAINFQNLSRYILQWGNITYKYKLNAPGGSVIDTSGFAGGDIDSEIDIDTANDISITFLGYFLYWSNQTRWLFGITPSATLDNLPSLVYPNATATLPYTSINFKRNPNDYPISESHTSSLQGQRKQIWFKISKSIDNNKLYKFKIQGTAVALQLANKLFTDQNYNVYNDFYIQSGSPLTYILNSENHSIKNRKTYISKGDDAQIRLVFALKNPAYWEELRRYINE